MLTGIGIVTRIDQSATISWQNRPIKFGQADDAMKLWEKAKAYIYDISKLYISVPAW